MLQAWYKTAAVGALVVPVVALGMALGTGVGGERSAAQASTVEIFGANWPEGAVGEEVGYYCIACHSLEIVKQQGLDKETWDDVIVWMEEDMGMNPLDDETQDRFTSFLAEYFGPDRKAMSGG